MSIRAIVLPASAGKHRMSLTTLRVNPKLPAPMNAIFTLSSSRSRTRTCVPDAATHGKMSAAVSASRTAGGRRAVDRRRNLVFITTDHQRYDSLGMTQCGREVTPALNRLALSSSRFDRAYDACPLCVPACTALATGLAPDAQRGRAQRP